MADLTPAGPYPTLPYLYPPLLAILVMPLTYIPIEAGALVLVALVVVEAAVLCLMLRRWIGWGPASVMVFLFLQTWVTVYFGQIGFVIAILLFAALQAIEQDRSIRLGVALSLGTLLKITPAAGLLLLLQRKYQWALIAAAATLLGVLLVFLPLAGVQRWIEGSIMALRVYWHVWWLASWTGILTYYIAPPYGETLSAILGLTALAYTLRRARQLPPQLALSALLLLPLLFARTTWGHHSVTALPILAVLWRRSPGNRLLAAAAWLLMALFDFRGVAPALTLCWAACVWPEHTGFLERWHARLSTLWDGVIGGGSGSVPGQVRGGGGG
jgi:alpha-1,2-mannosyltransferase